MFPCLFKTGMETSFLNYDQIATEYNQRYPSSQNWERGQALLDLAGQLRAKTVLEVGSGTGFWLNLLHTTVPNLFGLDYSMGMIKQAQRQPAPLKLARGSAVQLPYRDNMFDLVYCVDAIHHFGDHGQFITEAFRVLKPGGALAVIGHDPHEGTSQWYIYDYFNGVYDTDLRRYPSGRSVMKLMETAGYRNTSIQTVEHILNVHVGQGVLRDPFIKKSATSQLALLNDEEYSAGVKRIEETLARAAASGEQVVFSSDIHVKMFSGYKMQVDVK
jgi:SAM-dependent methyltransferase